MASVQLSSALQSNLVSLQNTDSVLRSTQNRLATGLRVANALDNPANFFAAAGHTQRADLMSALKDNIGEAIQTVKEADKGVSSVKDLIEGIRGQLTQARSALNDTTNSVSLLTGIASNYNELIRQLNNTANDASYKGVNFLSGGTLSVNFNENATTTLSVTGFNASASGLAITSGTATGAATTTSATFSTSAQLSTIEATLNTALATLQTQSANLASNLTILSSRNTFINDTVNTLREGATKLTEADQNQEGANLLTLQTRQQLGITALSISSQSAQGILRLF
jgi:flagellin-like hook-associated protein FlgL